MLSQNVKERNYEHIAIPGGLLPNAFNRFFVFWMCEKVTVVFFLNDTMSKMVLSMAAGSLPLPRLYCRAAWAACRLQIWGQICYGANLPLEK